MVDIIKARDITIRCMDDDVKCAKNVYGHCCVKIEDITSDMVFLPYWNEKSCSYIPENFCKGLAAKYLFSEADRQNLFTNFKCVRYRCGHIRMRSDMNHRMCVLAHLDKMAKVDLEECEDMCSDCDNTNIQKARKGETVWHSLLSFFKRLRRRS